MSQHVENVLHNTIDGLKKMIDVDSVIGKPLAISENTTVIPVSKVTMGFVSGGSGFGKTPGTDNFGGGAGGNVKITPIAFLVVTGDNVRLVNVSSSPDSVDKLLSKVPELIDQVKDLISKKKQDTEEE